VAFIFWARWSSHSLIEMGHLEDFHKKARRRGLEVIGVNVDSLWPPRNQRIEIEKFARQRGITYPLVFDPGLKAFRSFGLTTVPSTVVVEGQKGLIVITLEGYPSLGREDFFRELEKFLKDKAQAGLENSPKARLIAWKRYTSSRLLYSERKLNKALGLLQEAIAQDPGLLPAHALKGQILLERGELEEALKAAERALEVDAGSLAALTLKASILAEKGRHEESRRLIDRVLASNDTYAPALSLLGYLLGSRGSFEEAFEAYGQAEGLGRLDYRLYLLRGKTLESLGRLREAANQYRQALALLAGYEPGGWQWP
jgi:Flp pilus assembly protein TadD